MSSVLDARIHAPWVLVGATLLAACGSGTGPGGELEIARQDSDPDPLLLEAQSANGKGSHGFYVPPRIQPPPLLQRPSHEPADGDEPVGQESSALGSFFTRSYPAASGTFETLIHANQDICVLQGFTGAMRCPAGGSCASFRVGWPEETGVFNADQSDSYGPGANVTCFPRTYFTSPGPAFVPYAESYGYAYTWDQCVTFTGSDIVNGDHAIAITGLGYNFSGLADRIWVTQSDSVSSKVRWGVGSANAQCRTLNFYQSLALRGDGNPVRFYGPLGYGNATQAGEYDVQVGSSRHVDVALAPPQHLCFFTYIAGNIRTTADSIRIAGVSPNGAQHLFIDTSANGATARIKVRCVPYAQ